jgi:hypothetical protein
MEVARQGMLRTDVSVLAYPVLLLLSLEIARYIYILVKRIHTAVVVFPPHFAVGVC